MRWFMAAMLGLACTACERELSEAEEQQAAERATELVRAANDAGPPVRPVVPEAIEYPDIETHDLFGQSCTYAPGTNLGARVIAREADAFMKIDGEVVRFAADPGSRELPMRSRTLYNGREYSLRLAIDDVEAGTSAGEGTEVTEYEGTVWLRDRWDRVVYEGTGAVSCGV